MEFLVIVVIGIILSGMLLPAVLRAREKSRQAACRNNLHLFAVALDLYKVEAGVLASWLSNLHPKYVKDESAYLCPSDASGGTEGSIPDRPPFTTVAAPQLEETDDMPLNRSAAPHFLALRNPRVSRCSYLYEFACSGCSWWTGGSYPDSDADGIVSWREVRALVDQKGMQPDGTFDTRVAYAGRTPIVRCFWHVQRYDRSEGVLNLSANGQDIYESGPFGDDWKLQCKIK